MQVGACAAAGITGQRNTIAHRDALALADQWLRQMQIAGAVAVVMAHNDVTTGSVVVADTLDTAIGWRGDRGTNGHRKVGAVVRAHSTGDRV